MILESLNSEQADDVARQITELLSSLSLKAASEPVSTLRDSSLQVATIEADTKHDFTPLNSFAARLKMALAHFGMTQGRLAACTGVSQSTISSLVTGKVEPDIERADNIANALDIRFRWLMFGDGGMYKNLINGDGV
ncbi:helix-turn-helix domain-containing protein [Providencia heimbachae]|uniref:helix-turn-helix domain-containing protein n=1 Tax=Providencia heimbachae TaxID=333962 RepID=UPI001586AEA7|nr:helix-turn-helix transcriptional regulator [Providencia heimbachae]